MPKRMRCPFLIPAGASSKRGKGEYIMTFLEEKLEKKIWFPAEAICLLLGEGMSTEEKEEFGKKLLSLSPYPLHIGKNAYEIIANAVIGEGNNDPILLKFFDIYQKYNTYFYDEPITPYDFISWAMELKSIAVPAEMVEWKERQDRESLAPSAGDTKEANEEHIPLLDPRQETSYKALLAALLAHAGKYPWGERGGKAAAVKWLARELESLGCAVSERTIGKCLDGLPEAIRKKEIAPISRK